MKSLRIRRLGVASVAKFVGIANAIMGFIAGFFGMFAGLATVLTNDDLTWGSQVGASIGVVAVALVVLPIVSFALGWLYGAVFSLIANLFLASAHGIEVDVEEGK